mmetsp:Transcript_27741/g.60803  ORF Transcript_27741/g.60803 Transcript_27741/m.60803 type:complete len:599 (+) Transcript_27741:101-1897(+)
MSSSSSPQSDPETTEALPLYAHDEFIEASSSSPICLSRVGSEVSSSSQRSARSRSSVLDCDDSNADASGGSTSTDDFIDSPRYVSIGSPRYASNSSSSNSSSSSGVRRSRTGWLALATSAGVLVAVVGAAALLLALSSSNQQQRDAGKSIASPADLVPKIGGSGGGGSSAVGNMSKRFRGQRLQQQQRQQQSFGLPEKAYYDPLGMASVDASFDDSDDSHDDTDSRESESLDTLEEEFKEALEEHKKETSKGADDNNDPQATTHVESVPPLSELIHEEEIQGDVSWMLDFAIIGNPKCGTTFLMHWLSRSDDTFVHNGEVCSLSRDRPNELAMMYYDQVSHRGRMAQTDEGHRIKGGLKCPKEISTEKGLDNWSKFFPHTKFIITTRHPVLWFQSFYNYHAYGQWPKPVPHPNELIGSCYDESPYLCTDHCGTERPGNTKICTNRANFHHSLSRLGKTPMNTPEELRLIDHDMSIVPQAGKVFLMEISQLFPENEASKNLPEDISNFLDLKYDLHPLKARHGTGTHNHEYKDEERKQAFVDICEAQYTPVREVLIQQGKDAAEWITKYLMKSEDVVVSSPREFIKLLDKWGEDPCESK